MTPTEHTTKTPRGSTGLFASLCGFLRVKGTGASSASTLVLAALAVLALLPSIASANGGHAFGGTIGSGPGEGAGQLELVAPIRGIAGNPEAKVAGSGLAVNDETHDVYVADTGNHRVSEFEADGKFLRAFGKGVEPMGGDVCTELTECKAGGSGSAPGELQAPKFVAVDQGSGDVYVGDGVGKEAGNELQFVEINGATAGTYTLTFDGETTKPIAYTVHEGTPPCTGSGRQCADALAARSALEELLSIGPDNIKVEERPGENEKVMGLQVEFIGTLTEKSVPAFSCDSSGLTPAGASCQVSVEREGSKFVGEVVSKFTAEGALISSWGDSTSANGQLDGSGVEDGPFAGELGGLAVDSTGDLWVLSTGGTGETFGRDYIYEFDENGTYKGSTQQVEGGASASGLAVDGAGNLYLVGQHDCVEELGHGCVSGSHEIDPTGFALDGATEHVYVGLGSSLENADPSCLSLGDCEVLGVPQLQGGVGVAVDASVGDPPLSGRVYAANTVADQVDLFAVLLDVETAAASEVTVGGMTLNGTVDPEGVPVSECYFEYGTSSEYEHTAPCEDPDAEQLGSGTVALPVHAKIAGLRGGTTYHFRLVAKGNAQAVAGVDLTARTPTVPVVAGAEAPLEAVTGGSAELRATVDPEGEPVVSCTFEYGATTAYGSTVPCRPDVQHIGAGTEPVPVSATIEELVPNTTYHWRLSVTDKNGEAYRADHTFVYPTAGVELPDHRAYEMVTPPFKNGASIGTVFTGVNYDFSEDGSRVIAGSVQCLASSVSCTAIRGEYEGDPFEFTRTASGWSTTALAPSSAQFSENNVRLINPNEGTALFSMPTPPGGEDDWYLRSPAGAFTDIGPVSPPAAGQTELINNTQGFADATADFSHIVWVSGKQWPFADNEQPLEYSGVGNSQPFPVGVDDNGKPIGECKTYLGGSGGAGGAEQKYAMSADGRTVYFTVQGHDEYGCSSGVSAPPVSELYARIDGEEPVVEGVARKPETIAISQPQCGEGAALDEVECRKAPASDAVFVRASVDGSRAFFLDRGQLTDDATPGAGSASGEGGCETGTGSGCNLYEYDFDEPAGHKLIDVSAGDTSGLGPQVYGVVAASADGSHVYFVANGVLASGAHPGHCSDAGGAHGICNMYVYERDAEYPAGRIAFIASVPDADSKNWQYEKPEANVTPDGRFLVFKSFALLTPDDTRTDGYVQVFRYDADPTAEEEAGHVPQLVRISIGNDGYNDDGNGGVGDASIVPVARASDYEAGPVRNDPTMSDDGSYVFFQSPVALTPNALNDIVIGHTQPSTVEESDGIKVQTSYAQNVYEYHDGHVYLISDGRDTAATGNGPCSVHAWFNIGGAPSEEGPFLSDVCLLGASTNGANAFFTTSDQLVPEDTDTQVDIYDARICEPEANPANPCIQTAPQPLPPCLGEQCHGIPPARSSLLTGGSATFNGAVNPAPLVTPAKKVTKKTTTCKRGYVKKKVKKKELCVKKKSDKKAKKSAHKSAKGRK